MNFKTCKRILPINLYLIMTTLCIIIWSAFPELIGFIGASSLVWAFLFAVGAENFWVGMLALAWIPILIVCIIVFYLLASKYNKYMPFIAIVGMDLLISALLIGSKIYSGNDTDLGIMLVGYAVRTIYYIWMIYWVYRIKK